MKLIKTEDAVGHVLCHDMTQIIKGVTKDARFRKGHIVTEEDIPVLLSMGKENLYVWEKKEGILHEDEAAAILRDLCINDNMTASEPKEENSAQFDISDTRTLDEVVNWLLDMGHIPSFCTACYRAGRTGDRFMSLVKSGQIANCCAPNALMTLKEYLEDYASADTRAKGEVLIQKELKHIPNPKIKEIAARNLKEIIEGKRDFRF